METTELQYLLHQSPLLAPLNGVVCSKDQLPSHRPDDVRAYIVNTHNSDQPGEHWVVVFFNENTGYYFDSYALPPYKDEIRSFLDRNTQRYTWNPMRLQGTQTYVCGLYCIYALHFLSRGCDLKRVLRARFRTEDNPCFFLNDNNVGMWFQQNYGELFRRSRHVQHHIPNQECTAQDPPEDPIGTVDGLDARFFFDVYAHDCDRYAYHC